MDKITFERIFKKEEKNIIALAQRNGLMWFYKMHQKEVVKSAKELLKSYPKADSYVVILSCLLHDIAYYDKKGNFQKTRGTHHIKSAEIAKKLLANYNLEAQEVEKIAGCIIKHRNSAPYQPKTLEEKIVAVSDTLSHFKSIFYLTYFKFYPKASLEDMVKEDLEKMNRDWKDLALLPKARGAVKRQFEVLKELLLNYKGI